MRVRSVQKLLDVSITVRVRVPGLKHQPLWQVRLHADGPPIDPLFTGNPRTIPGRRRPHVRHCRWGDRLTQLGRGELEEGFGFATVSVRANAGCAGNECGVERAEAYIRIDRKKTAQPSLPGLI